MNQIDLSIFRRLNSWVGVNDFWDWNVLFRAEYLIYVIIAAVFLSYSFDKNQTRAKWVIIHAFSAGILSRFIFTEIIRFFYDRPRPFEILDNVSQLIFHESSGSFPSGNAAFSFAVAAAIYYYYPKTSIFFFLASIAMGLGRVSAGVHWPSDILGGAVVGIFSAWLVKILIKKLKWL